MLDDPERQVSAYKLLEEDIRSAVKKSMKALLSID